MVGSPPPGIPGNARPRGCFSVQWVQGYGQVSLWPVPPRPNSVARGGGGWGLCGVSLGSLPPVILMPTHGRGLKPP